MRIFVFRPQADAERTARAVTAHGHEPVVAPLFTIVPSGEPHPEGPFDALVLTSGNGVGMLADTPPSWREIPVFTVGARTAAKAREAGFEDSRSADGDRHDLISLIAANLPTAARLLMIAGRDRHEDVPDRLGAAGFEVVIWTAYAAEAVEALPANAVTAIAAGEADVALHFSARGAQTFLSLAAEAGMAEAAAALTHVTLSAEVAAPLIKAGADTVLVAEYPEEAALFAALDGISDRHGLSGGVADVAVPSSVSSSGEDAMQDAERPVSRRSKSRRTPPTIEGQSLDVPTEPVGATNADPETVLPTEALPHEFAPPETTPPPSAEDDAPAAQPMAPPPPAAEPRRSSLPALALAGLVGGVIGAGVIMLAMSRAEPAISPEQIAELRSRIEALQGQTAALDRKAQAADAAAAKAGADAQAASTRLTELAGSLRAQTPDPAAMAGLTAQAQRAEAAAASVGQRLDQASARIGSVETLAKSAAAPSPQAMAAARIVLAERVQSAIASGQPFADDVAALSKGGGAPEQLAALTAVATAGAPTRDALLAQLRTQRAMLAREMTPASAGWQDQLLGLANRIVTIRPVGDDGSNDPGTLLIRLENAIAAGNNTAAAALWNSLPEPARRASTEFGENLKKRAAADAAIAKIAQDAVAALGVAG